LTDDAASRRSPAGRAPVEFGFGRAVFEVAGRTFLAQGEATRPGDFVWLDPATWRHAPDLTGRRIALVGNSEVLGFGSAIDDYDDVLRFNHLRTWRHSAADDGVRITIWAGMPVSRYVRNHLVPPSEAERSFFPDVVSGVRLIWALNPFHTGARFVYFLRQRGLSDKFFLSGGSLFFFDLLVKTLPAAMVRSLYTIPNLRLPGGASNLRFNFDLMLSGVQAALFCFLGGAREIGLFGFTFYKGVGHLNWGGHDLAYNERFLAALTAFAATQGCAIRRFGA
jgi:hypothetical protein